MKDSICVLAIEIDDEISLVQIPREKVEQLIDPVLIERTLDGETIYIPVVDNNYQVVYT